jgi:hypothetical protein
LVDLIGGRKVTTQNGEVKMAIVKEDMTDIGLEINMGGEMIEEGAIHIHIHILITITITIEEGRTIGSVGATMAIIAKRINK